MRSCWGAQYVGAVHTDRRAALEALHKGVRDCLPRVEPTRLAWRRSRNSPTVAELIGLLLMDLDLLSSRPLSDRDSLPEFATEFMNKRLARRLAERHRYRDLAVEFDRRFAAAKNLVTADQAEFAPILGRLRSRLEELDATLN